MVEILSHDEDLAWVLTHRGGFVVTPIPYSIRDHLEDLETLAPAPNLYLAKVWVREIWSLALWQPPV